MNYKSCENKYKVEGDTALITVYKKDGSELICKVDADDVEKLKSMGTWFAEWTKEFNDYTVQNISSTLKNKKNKPLKQSIQTFILNTNPKAPVKHINDNMLDNRKCNLTIVSRNQKNDIERIDENTIAIILNDKYGNPHAKALISPEDLDLVVNDKYSWVEHGKHDKISVVANTPDGRIYLDKLLMNPDENEVVHHINLNPLDLRRSNLEIKEV